MVGWVAPSVSVADSQIPTPMLMPGFPLDGHTWQTALALLMESGRLLSVMVGWVASSVAIADSGSS